MPLQQPTSRRGSSVPYFAFNTPNPPLPAKAASTGIMAHPYYKMMLNPFDGDTSALPDEAGHQTVAMKFRETITVTPDAQGNSVYVFRGILRTAKSWYAIAADGTLGAVSGAGGVGDAPEQATIGADFSALRSLAFAVNVTYIGAEQTAAGRIGMFCSTNPLLTGLKVADLLTDCDTVGPAHEGAAAIVRPYARPDFQISTDDTLPYMSSLVLVLAACPPGVTSIQVEVIRHLELVPINTSLHFAAARFTPCSHCVLECASNLGSVKQNATGRNAKQQLLNILKRLGPAAVRSFLTSDPSHLLRASVGGM